MDLEGAEFHNERLLLAPDYRFKPIFYLQHGQFYTKRLSDEFVARMSLNSSPGRRDVGKVAYHVSADLSIEEGFVVLTNHPPDAQARVGPEDVVLPKEHGVRYVITVESDCTIPGDFEGTDFRMFYDVVGDPRRITFDLRRIVQRLSTGSDGREFALDFVPRDCLMGFLSITPTLTPEP
ncbi:MAG TPA: hypothetical protein VFV34_28595 [Blastocatellia bacterium]|nr:hypothetical protein [Blastocatellia bacterium]